MTTVAILLQTPLTKKSTLEWLCVYGQHSKTNVVVQILLLRVVSKQRISRNILSDKQSFLFKSTHCRLYRQTEKDDLIVSSVVAAKLKSQKAKPYKIKTKLSSSSHDKWLFPENCG